MPELDFSDNEVLLFLAFALAPIISTFALNLLTLLGEKEISPIIPQINGFSFGQLVGAWFAVLIVNQEGKFAPLSTLGGALYVFVLLQVLIDKQQKQITKDHVWGVLKNRFGLSPDRLKAIQEISDSLIEADFFPNSLLNQFNNWSGHSRQKRREQLLQLVKVSVRNTAQAHTQGEIDEKVFIVPIEKRRGLRVAYFLVTSASLLIYLLGVAVFLSISLT
ncbi:MAG: hypothetical protein K8L91_15975 [Anaerolineae bacterium]|nr:hypothetical protein [Anaerolineae bacterium]